MTKRVTDRVIMLVEDEPDARYLGTKRLRAAGFEVIQASDGLDAIKKMLDHPACRQMVTDCNMPGLGGQDWIRFLERFCADWTVVVVSSADIDPGPFFSIPKPIDFENLVQIFNRRPVFLAGEAGG
jgi:CheY-like chemotaxis protein